VSGLNACDYCFGVHRTTAQAFGIEEGLLTSLLADIETADIDQRIRALMWYVGKVTKEPARVSPADAQRVLDAGWDEHALHDAVWCVRCSTS
jgi:alkylhydroperoxidase family enzyme